MIEEQVSPSLIGLLIAAMSGFVMGVIFSCLVGLIVITTVLS